MKRWSKIVLTLIAMVVWTASALAEWTAVKLDPVHSRIGFTASTLLFDVNGRFDEYELRVEGDPTKVTGAKVALSIDAASIDTRNKRRDQHLRSPDFLDVKKFPKITFVSESITQTGNVVNVIGTLDLHGVKKTVSIAFKKVQGKNGAGVDTTSFKGTLTIDRNQYGVGTDSVAAKISLQNEVVIDLLVVAFL